MLATVQCDENALVEYADGLLADREAAAVLHHLDGCAGCRAVVAGLIRAADADSVGSARPATAPVEVEAVPASLVRQHLSDEASKRERIAMSVLMAVPLVTIPLMLLSLTAKGPGFGLTGASIQVVAFIYAAIMLRMLRRGLYHPWLPLINTVVESMVFGIMYAASVVWFGARAGPGWPAMPLWGAYIVFTAVRVDARIPLVAGGIAAAETLGLSFLYLGATGSQVVPPFTISATVARTVFFAVAGGMGALLARFLLSRTQAALRAIREQDMFGKYLLGERLGSGGMGEVFRATYCPEGGFVRTVAIKRVRADLSADPVFDRAFRDEARVCSGLVHPNLVQVLDCGKFRGQFVLVMEFVEGMSLGQLLRRSPVPLEVGAVACLGAELAAALDYLHSRRASDGSPLHLVHCDLNPPNVLLSRRGEVKLGDFGVARIGGPTTGPLGRRFAGKLAYAAPEQLQGGAIVPRTDLFALGITLFQALNGLQAPRRSPTGSRNVDAVLRTRNDVPPQFQTLIADLVEADPRDRPQDAAEVRARLLALPRDIGPYPSGPALLAAAVERALRTPLPPSS
jgi:eukaryotic-like serine/threonine-protein kinase